MTPELDNELVQVLSKAVEELGLDWASPEEPTRSRLDEWFLRGSQQAPCQRSALFLPEVHDELTKSWCASYSARLRTSTSATLSTIDGTVEKGYEKLPPLKNAMAWHFSPCWEGLRVLWPGRLCPPHHGGPPGVPGKAPPVYG